MSVPTCLYKGGWSYWGRTHHSSFSLMKRGRRAEKYLMKTGERKNKNFFSGQIKYSTFGTKASFYISWHFLSPGWLTGPTLVGVACGLIGRWKLIPPDYFREYVPGRQNKRMKLVYLGVREFPLGEGVSGFFLRPGKKKEAWRVCGVHRSIDGHIFLPIQICWWGKKLKSNDR